MKIGIVGGGILGLATAYKLSLKFPAAQLSLFEKEAHLGCHQTGRNSGVLHSGLAYKPGSLKARLAVDGIRQMVAFCREQNLPHEICGKVVVAADRDEEPRLEALASQGQSNGLQGLRFLTPRELEEREPSVRGTKALLVPEEGIVDFSAVVTQLEFLLRERGVEILLSSGVESVIERDAGEVTLETKQGDHSLDYVIFCAGLHSDRMFSRATKQRRPIRIVPFRGEYYTLDPSGPVVINHLVYPVPDPQFPFLGVHFTRRIDGRREVGPNAVLAFKREGYRMRSVCFEDLFDTLSYSGFLRFLRSNWMFSMEELATSIFQQAFVQRAQKLVPGLQKTCLQSGSAGVRAQAIGEDGELLKDFVVQRARRQIHVLNAPSPGATASFAIADYILEQYLDESLL